jgi:hypothetical protein
MMPPDAERVLAAALRGEAPCWPFAGETASRAFVAAALRHRVVALVVRQIRHGALQGIPAQVERTLAQAVVRQAIVEQRLAGETRRVIDALGCGGVPALLLKGAALAYTCYPHPCLRPRVDTDLLIRPRDSASTAAVFERLGYRGATMTGGDLLLHQRSYEMTDGLGVRHLFDVHEKIAAPHAVANLLQWEELNGQSSPVPALGIHARALGDSHALVLACLHRVAHHYDDPCLLWLYDIHLLAKRGQVADPFFWREVGRLTQDRAAAAMCARSLTRAREWVNTPVPSALMEALAARADNSAAAFARGRKIDVLLSDLNALSGWRQRLELLREHLLPPPDYIRSIYGVSSRLLLPALYAHRVVSGAWRWMQPERKQSTSPG